MFRAGALCGRRSGVLETALMRDLDPYPWRPVYELYTQCAEQPSPEALGRVLPEWLGDHEIVRQRGAGSPGALWLVDPQGVPLVQVEHGAPEREPEGPFLGMQGTAAGARLLRRARARFVISVRVGGAPAVHLVQVALAAAWAVLTTSEGVLCDLSALRLLHPEELEALLSRDRFAIEDHVCLHLVTDPRTETAWLHSHGMEKFGRSDLETFELDVGLGRDAGKLMNELMLSSALGTRLLLGERIELPGGDLRALLSEAMRLGVKDLSPEELVGHEGPYLCLVDAATCGSISALVDGYLHRALTGVEDLQRERESCAQLLPLLRKHFSRKGVREGYEYFARIPLRIWRGERTSRESVWVKITRWHDRSLWGTLASDSVLDSRLQMGMEVAFEPKDIEAILLSEDGQPVDGQHLEKLLRS